jgi:hypothetical protein
MFGFGGGNGERSVVNEIVDGLVYLSNLPRNQPFSHYAMMPLQNDSALVVSCVDMNELAKSGLLLEPHAGKVRYHVLPMLDVVAEVGHQDQIIDTLVLMSSFADRKKPIHIHCREGVGRSAMMTALHISLRYLLKDPIITECIDSFAKISQTKLDSESGDFISDLYTVVSNYVQSKRPCCQFYDRNRNDLARKVLTEIQGRIKLGQPLVNAHDENYQFLAELTASAKFKALMHHTCRGTSFQIATFNQFAELMLTNADGWYQQLDEVADGEILITKPDNLLVRYCYARSLEDGKPQANVNDTAGEGDRFTFLVEFKWEVERLAKKLPESIYAKSVNVNRHENSLTQ